MINLSNDFVIISFLVAFILTTLLVPPCILFIKKIGLIDNPKLHKHPGIIHTKPIPRGGGLPLFLGAFLAGILFLPLTTTTIAIFAASFLALVVGLIDDYLNAKGEDISPYLRFFMNILTALIIVASGVSIRFITDPFGGIIHLDAIKIVLPFLSFPLLLSDIISVLWLVWIMNMLNWSKGVDGQMPGIVAISAIIIGILSLRQGTENLLDAKLSFIIAGSAVGFLLFNFHPAKIFPGYGATSLYLLLGVASILSSAKLATAILVMGVPIVDALFTIIRRIANRKSPFQHDRKHLHHILLQLGWGQRQIALFYWCISIIMVVVITGGGLLFLHTVTKKPNDKIAS